MADESITREALVDLLNEDLAREYQAIIAYVVYSQVLKGAAYMNIAEELEVHAGEELAHAITIARHIDYLGGMPTATAKPVVLSDKAEVMLRADLDNENDTIKNYRERLKQCEALQEYAIAEDIREILRQEQEHQVDLATALGEETPDVSRLGGEEKAASLSARLTSEPLFPDVFLDHLRPDLGAEDVPVGISGHAFGAARR